MTTLHCHVVLLLLALIMMLCNSLHSLLSVRVSCRGDRGRMLITATTPFSSLLVLGPLHRRMLSSTSSNGGGGGGGIYTCSGGDSMQLFSSSSKYSHGSNSNSHRNNNDGQHNSRNTNKTKSGRSSDSMIEVRLNKCIHSLSRRAADDAIAAGRAQNS